MKNYCDKHPEKQDAIYILSTLIKNDSPVLFHKLIKRLLVSADKYYDYAHRYTDPIGLSTKEFLRLIYNLHRSLRYKEALRLLTYWQEQNSWDRRLQLALADTYYRIRKYAKAARLYEKNRRYKLAAISYFRAHDENAVEILVNLTKHLKGKTPCTILILRGRQLRDENKPKAALNYFRRAYRQYQDCKEEALWEIGWTEYLQGQYLHAAYNFRDLFVKYNRPKYLYWLKKSNSFLKLKELDIKGEITKSTFYYSLLNYNANKYNYILNPSDYKLSFNNYFNFYILPDNTKKRISVLEKAGLREYIKRELLYKLRYDRDNIEKYTCALLKYGFYREALNIARKNHFSDVILKKQATYPLSYKDYIAQIARRFSLDPLLLLSVMRVESRFDPEALSRSGAIGLMQLMDFTALRWARKEGLDISLDDDGNNSVFRPEINIRLGAVYLKWLLDKFQNPFLAVAAYNAGENAVSRWLKELKYNGLDEFLELIPYDETRNYVKKVFSTYETYRKIYLTTNYSTQRN